MAGIGAPEPARNAASMFAIPSHANEVRGLIVMGIEFALIGIENGMSDPPRQVNIGCPDGNLALGMVYAHDPLQGMFFSLRHLGMARQLHYLLLVPSKEAAAQDQLPCREIVMDAMAGRAKLLLEVVMLLFRPLPAPAQVYRLTLRA